MAYNEDVEKMKTKGFSLYSQGEEGALLQVIQHINEEGLVYALSFSYRSRADVRYNQKVKTRNKDKTWIYHNIPSSIWWHTAMHHEWKNGGVMFLLTPEEHRKITKREVRERYDRRKEGLCEQGNFLA